MQLLHIRTAGIVDTGLAVVAMGEEEVKMLIKHFGKNVIFPLATTMTFHTPSSPQGSSRAVPAKVCSVIS